MNNPKNYQLKKKKEIASNIKKILRGCEHARIKVLPLELAC